MEITLTDTGAGLRLLEATPLEHAHGQSLHVIIIANRDQNLSSI